MKNLIYSPRFKKVLEDYKNDKITLDKAYETIKLAFYQYFYHKRKKRIQNKILTEKNNKSNIIKQGNKNEKIQRVF